ncbi:MAG: ferredoxin [Terriglobales bacterium]
MPGRKFNAYPLNTPGPFYVEADECIACRAPEAVAPDLIGFVEDETGRHSHCYFKKQPETAAELEQAIQAVGANCCGSFHYAGADLAVKKKLKAAHSSGAIDNP